MSNFFYRSCLWDFFDVTIVWPTTCSVIITSISEVAEFVRRYNYNCDEIFSPSSLVNLLQFFDGFLWVNTVLEVSLTFTTDFTSSPFSTNITWKDVCHASYTLEKFWNANAYSNDSKSENQTRRFQKIHFFWRLFFQNFKKNFRSHLNSYRIQKSP